MKNMNFALWSKELNISKHSIKAEIYTFGMLMLEIGTFEDNLYDAYGKF